MSARAEPCRAYALQRPPKKRKPTNRIWEKISKLDLFTSEFLPPTKSIVNSNWTEQYFCSAHFASRAAEAARAARRVAVAAIGACASGLLVVWFWPAQYCARVCVRTRVFVRLCSSAHRVMEASAGYKREGILSFQSISTHRIATVPPPPARAAPPGGGGGAPGPP